MFEKLSTVPRWKDYPGEDNGDRNVATHTLRQADITYQALLLDAKFAQLTSLSKDILMAAVYLHDLGELVVGDITKDLKDANKFEMEMAEARAVIDIIKGEQNLHNEFTRDALIEIYLHVTTSLSEQNKLSFWGVLIDEDTDDDPPWDQLNKLFALYERYGYMITALQEYPLPLSTQADDLHPAQLKLLRSWNRGELTQAEQNGYLLDETTRKMMLVKNVLLNNWQKILEASKQGIPSAQCFFNNKKTENILRHANELMHLGLDLSVFDHVAKIESNSTSKVYSNPKELAAQLLTERGRNIVITGGVFDLFHQGQLDYLREAKDRGDILIVHVDGDQHTRQRKGPSRPVIPQDQRANIVASLSFVDYVLTTEDVFYADNILQFVQPTTIVRTMRRDGTRSKSIIELMAKYPHIQIIEIAERPDISTTKIVRRIKEATVSIDLEELTDIERSLIAHAKSAAQQAYSYSHFSVGAAAIDENGEIFSGCNISNASPTCATCAERHAIAAAITHGSRSIQTIVVYSPGQSFVSPCGPCRQVIQEFSPQSPTRVILANDRRNVLISDIQQLLPLPFTSSRKAKN